MEMPLEVVVEMKEHYLFVQITGQYNQQEAAHHLARIGEQCRETHYQCVLADFRGHTGMIETLDLHRFGELASKTFPKGCCVAMVVSEDRVPMDRFLETVARNRGAMLRIFTRLEDAESWLMDPSTCAGQKSL